MEGPRISNPLPSPTAERGRFTWPGLALAVVAAPAAGLICAWIGAMVQPHFAPLILFPVLLGVFAGLTIVGLVRFARIGNRPTIFLAAVLAAAVAVAGQHYFNYLVRVLLGRLRGQARRPGKTWRRSSGSWRRASAGICAPRPDAGGRWWAGTSPTAGLAWLTWAIDAMLVAAAAVAVTVPAARVPYCNRCGTWYRSVRSGRIDVPTARRLAELLGVEEIEGLRSPRYRLSSLSERMRPDALRIVVGRGRRRRGPGAGVARRRAEEPSGGDFGRIDRRIRMDE